VALAAAFEQPEALQQEGSMSYLAFGGLLVWSLVLPLPFAIGFEFSGVCMPEKRRKIQNQIKWQRKNQTLNVQISNCQVLE
jgi:hypothetical protein